MVRFLGIGGKPKVSAETTIGLTELGKREAEKWASQGRRFLMLSKLNERPMTVSELSDECGCDVREAEVVVDKLIRSGYVRTIGGNGE